MNLLHFFFRRQGLCLTFFLLTIPLVISAQEIEDEVIKALIKMDEIVSTADSTAYFNLYSPDFKLLRHNGQVLNQQDVWQMIKKMHLGMKQLMEIKSVEVNGSVAWITYYYSFIKDENNKYKDKVIKVDSLANPQWLSTSILEKQEDKWKYVLHHYSRIEK